MITELIQELPAEIETKLSRDLKNAAATLQRKEARYLVDLYYTVQQYRIDSAGQVRSSDGEEPNALLTWSTETFRAIEDRIKYVLGKYAAQWTVGKWLQSICGIGPVLSAGLLAHLDVRTCDTAGRFWSFAGLNPTVKWERGQKRPWNAKLKVLTWKCGESFVKMQGRESDFYGELFAARKASEWQRNLSGALASEAERALSEKKYGKDTVAYRYYSGQLNPDDVRGFLDTGESLPITIKPSAAGGVPMLPPAHIHARARRYAVKLFLSHLHHVMYCDYYDRKPPVPYAFEHPTDGGDHRHFIEPPNWPVIMEGRSLKQMYVDNAAISSE